MAIHLGSQLDPWPRGIKILPCMVDGSGYLDREQTLQECRMADGTLLRNADGKWAKAYSYWMVGPYDGFEWAQLKRDAPEEVQRVGEYLITKQKLNIRDVSAPDPEWMHKKCEFKDKIICICILAFCVGIIALTIFLSLRGNKK